MEDEPKQGGIYPKSCTWAEPPNLVWLPPHPCRCSFYLKRKTMRFGYLTLGKCQPEGLCLR